MACRFITEFLIQRERGEKWNKQPATGLAISMFISSTGFGHSRPFQDNDHVKICAEVLKNGKVKSRDPYCYKNS